MFWRLCVQEQTFSGIMATLKFKTDGLCVSGDGCLGTEVSTQNVSRSHLILLDELLLDLVLGLSLFLPRLSGLTSLTSAAFCWKIICQAFSRAGGECKILQGKFRAASCSAKFGLTSSRLSSESSLFKSWNVEKHNCGNQFAPEKYTSTAPN